MLKLKFMKWKLLELDPSCPGCFRLRNYFQLTNSAQSVLTLVSGDDPACKVPTEVYKNYRFIRIFGFSIPNNCSVKLCTRSSVPVQSLWLQCLCLLMGGGSFG